MCVLELLQTTYAFYYYFELDDPLIQLRADYKWILFWDFSWRLGIDGLSIGPILLMEYITTLATLATWATSVRRNKLINIDINLNQSQDIYTFNRGSLN